MNIYRKHIITLIVFLIFSTFIIKINAQEHPIAKKGVIDLSNWNFDTDGITNLHGEWEFYWEKLLTPQDFEGYNLLLPKYLTVPGLWNGTEINNKQIPTFGYGTYRLNVKINYQNELSIKTLGAATAYKIWIDGRLAGEIGKVNTSKDSYTPKEKPAIYNIYPIENYDSIRTVEIIIQVANFSHSKSGLWEKIEIGATNQIQEKERKANLWDAIVIGILLIMAIYHFGLFVLWRKEYSTLYLGLFVLFMAIRNLVTNNQLILDIFPGMSFSMIVRLQFFSAFPNIIFAGLFFYFLFQKYFQKKILYIIFGISIIFSVIIIFSPPFFFTTLTNIFGIYLFASSTYFVIVLLKAIKAKEQGSILALIGMIAMLITGFIDIYTTIFLSTIPYLAPYGVVLFIFFQSYMLAQRFSRAFNKNIILTNKLNFQNNNLGKIIALNTKEIKEKVEELQASEEELKQNNEELKSLNDNIDNQNVIIKQKEEKLRRILSSVGEGVGITDFNENFLFANKAADKIFGVGKGKLVGKNLREFIDDEEWTRIIIESSRRKDNESSTYQIKLTLPNQKTKHIIVTAVPDEEHEGSISATIGVFRDITKRVTEENKIKELKNQLEILINHIPAYIYYKDLDLKYLLVNNSYADVINTPKNNIIGKTDDELIPQDIANEYQALDRQIIEEKKPIINFEKKHINQYGEEYWGSTSKVPYFDSNGNIVGIIGIVQDITESKNSAKLLSEKNKDLIKYYTAIEQSPVTIIFTDLEGNIQYANPEFYKLTGYSVNESIGKNMSMLKSGLTPKKSITELWTTIKKGKTWHGEFHNVKKDGTGFIEKAIITPIRNEDSEITGFIGIKEDITEEKIAEQVIKEKNEQQKILINNLPAHIYYKDLELRYLLVNDSFANLLELPIDEIIGKTDAEISPREIAEKYENLDLALLASKKPILNFEEKHLNEKGEEFWISISKVPYFDNKKNIIGIIGIVLDITQRKKDEQIIFEKTKQFENTITNMVDIYVKCDFSGKFINVSPSIIDEFNCSSTKEIYNSNMFDWIIVEDKEKEKFFRTLLKEKRITNFAFKFKRIGDNDQFAEINANVFFINGKPAGFEAIIRNITQRVVFENELRNQKDIIEEAHKDITSSIEYAKYIQEALLPQKQILDKFFKHNFIFFKPKDVVSGDFYYFKEIDNSQVFAVADCTGHGVPGGFMTMLSITMLDEIIRTEKNLKPSNILEKLRKRVKNIFAQFGTKNSNGLDIAICIMDAEKKELQFSGANNPLYLIRDNELLDYNSTKNPIGFYFNESPFQNHIIYLEKNDVIYLFSDGYKDQFGGERRSKFTKKRFKKMLINIHLLPMEEQKIIVEENFEQWKADNEQIDDITVIGLRID